MGKLMRRLLSSTGYLLYTLVVLVCLLWLLFPAKTVKDWFEYQLDKQSSQYSWKIGSITLVLSSGLVMTDVRMISMEDKKLLLKLDRVTLMPDGVHFFRKNRAINYTLHLLKGDVRGRILFNSGSKQITCRGTVDGLLLNKMDSVQQELGRTFDGVAGGSFSTKGKWNEPAQIQLQGNLRLTEGILQFRKSVLGLDELPYTKIEAGFKFQEGKWIFDKGTLQAAAMNGTFSGSVQAEDTLAAGRLQFKGTLLPRSEMFAGLKTKQMVEVVRTHLKDGGLPFTVNGTAGEPGIVFSGALSQALRKLKRSTK